MRKIIVRQGDTLSLIAEKHGFVWQTLWDHSENKELREKRGDPDVLFPGDCIVIPDRKRRDEGASSEQRHTFKAKRPGTQLRLILRDAQHQPVGGARWQLEFDENEKTDEASTKDDGLIEVEIPSGKKRAILHVDGREVPLVLRALDPANTPRGIQQRLANLGYDVGAEDGELGPVSAAALREFQTHEEGAGLSPTGEPSKDTLRRLRELHEAVVLDGPPNKLDGSDDSAAQNDTSKEDSEEEEDYEAEEEVDEDEAPPGFEDLGDDHEDEDEIGMDDPEKATAPNPARPISVVAIQEILDEFGYEPGPIDGISGPLTRAAVKEFQTDAELVVDGIVGPNTSTELREGWEGG